MQMRMTSNYSTRMPSCNSHTSLRSQRQEWLDHIPVRQRAALVLISWQDRQDCLANSSSFRTWTLPYLVNTNNKSIRGEPKLLEGQATNIYVSSHSLQPAWKPSSPRRRQSKNKTLPQITDIYRHATGTQKSQTLPWKAARSPHKAKGSR